MDRKYTVNRYTRQDRKYGKILNELPYDEQLDEFFLSENRRKRRESKARKRHINEEATKLMNSGCDIFSGPDLAHDKCHISDPDIKREIKKLPERQKRRLLKRYLAGFSLAEIGLSENVTGCAVSGDIRRTLKKLRLQLEKE